MFLCDAVDVGIELLYLRGRCQVAEVELSSAVNFKVFLAEVVELEFEVGVEVIVSPRCEVLRHCGEVFAVISVDRHRRVSHCC